MLSYIALSSDFQQALVAISHDQRFSQVCFSHQALAIIKDSRRFSPVFITFPSSTTTTAATTGDRQPRSAFTLKPSLYRFRHVLIIVSHDNELFCYLAVPLGGGDKEVWTRYLCVTNFLTSQILTLVDRSSAWYWSGHCHASEYVSLPPPDV